MPPLVRITPASTTPIFRQIVDQIALQVRRGELTAGMALPSVRTLAEALVLNPNTVARAYQELIHLGVVEAQRGRGMFIAEPRELVAKAERERRLQAAIDRVITEAAVLRIPAAEVRAALDRELHRLQSSTTRPAAKDDHA